jgi:iron(III) transport system substrate-binding protein
MMRRTCLVVLALSFVAAMAIAPGCQRGPQPVVVYCAHDREFAEEILRAFTQKTGIPVAERYDTEANKSVGLYEDLVREAAKPRCDVHWNNEILATIRLQNAGVLATYASPSAEPFPAAFKAKDATWTAFAARARVLLVNSDVVKEADAPRGLLDLTQPQWKGRVAMAKPMFGTTASHAACLFQSWGKAEAQAFYRKLKDNGVNLLPGNKQVAVAVGGGQFAVGMTDTDDAMAEITAGKPVRMVFPDRDASADGKRGVLFLPNTVAMVKGCPNPDGARQLIDYLLSPEVETRLARSSSRQIPLNPKIHLDSLKPIETPSTVRAMPVDFAQAAEVWAESQQFLVDLFALR